jgi:hypothetical protein
MAADVFEQQFTQIYNGLFRDPRLSFKAKGIFGLISTHRDGFGVSLESIAACATDGISGVRTGLLELIAFDYLQRDRDRNELGRLGDAVYFITDMPDGLIILMNPNWDAVEVQNPRSEPKCDSPTLAEPTLDDRPHKKTNHQNISKKNTNNKLAPSARSAPDARRAPTGSSARDSGGFAAPGNSSARLTIGEKQAVQAVRDALPRYLDRELPVNLRRDTKDAFLKALAAGTPYERTPAQLVQYRVLPRWDGYYGSLFGRGEVKSPVGAVLEMLKYTPECGNARCDDRRDVDTGQPCINCAERVSDKKRVRQAMGGKGQSDSHPDAAVPTLPEQRDTEQVLPMRTCDGCERAYRAAQPGLCGECRELQHT